VTASITAGPVTALRRISFNFHPAGTAAACLAGPGEQGLQAELWRLDGFRPVAAPVGQRPAETRNTQVVPTGDGRVLAVRARPGRHALALLCGQSEECSETPVGRVGTRALRLLPSPDRQCLGVAVGLDVDGHTSVWRIPSAQPGLELVLRVPGRIGGGVWLDGTGRRLAVNHRTDDRALPVLLDLDAGTLAPLDGLRPGDLPLLASPAGGRLLVIRTGTDGARLALWTGGEVRVPAALGAVPGSLLPLAFAPDGNRLAVAATRGARTHLVVYDDDRDATRELDIPAGTVGRVGTWNRSALWFPYSSPVQPPAIAGATDTGEWVAPDPPAGRRCGWAPAHVERLTGPAGPMEAIVYGGRSWRDSRRLVVALHGGPEAAWHLEFDPLWQRLAARGVAVVAPNPHGSTGYGPEFRTATHHGWGVADLADIAQLGRDLRDHRRGLGLGPPALYGVSYGAYLALLSASLEPDAWSRCAVLAPFLSGARLYRTATAPVCRTMDRLGGADGPEGPDTRDVWHTCGRIRAPLLILHGADDLVVPPDQSWQLRERLRALGRREGTDFACIEVPGAGHDAVADPSAAAGPLLLRFLTGTGPDPCFPESPQPWQLRTTIDTQEGGEPDGD
jgi:alpha-beta hydrolase superfamily lysophospholipase